MKFGRKLSEHLDGCELKKLIRSMAKQATEDQKRGRELTLVHDSRDANPGRARCTCDEIEKLEKSLSNRDFECEICAEELRTGVVTPHRCALGSDQGERTALAMEGKLILPEEGQIWKHYKGGLYKIVCTAFNELDGNVFVVYSAQDTGVKILRPLQEFLGFAGHSEKRTQRFTLIEKS